MKVFYEYGIYRHVYLFHVNDRFLIHAFTLLNQGIGYDDLSLISFLSSKTYVNIYKDLQVKYIDKCRYCFLNPDIYICYNDIDNIKYTNANDLPVKLFTKVIDIYINNMHIFSFHIKLKQIFNKLPNELFCINSYVMDVKGRKVPCQYTNVNINYEYYYRLLIKHVFPYLKIN